MGKISFLIFFAIFSLFLISLVLAQQIQVDIEYSADYKDTFHHLTNFTISFFDEDDNIIYETFSETNSTTINLTDEQTEQIKRMHIENGFFMPLDEPFYPNKNYYDIKTMYATYQLKVRATPEKLHNYLGNYFFTDVSCKGVDLDKDGEIDLDDLLMLRNREMDSELINKGYKDYELKAIKEAVKNKFGETCEEECSYVLNVNLNISNKLTIDDCKVELADPYGTGVNRKITVYKKGQFILRHSELIGNGGEFEALDGSFVNIINSKISYLGNYDEGIALWTSHVIFKNNEIIGTPIFLLAPNIELYNLDIDNPSDGGIYSFAKNNSIINSNIKTSRYFAGVNLNARFGEVGLNIINTKYEFVGIYPGYPKVLLSRYWYLIFVESVGKEIEIKDSKGNLVYEGTTPDKLTLLQYTQNYTGVRDYHSPYSIIYEGKSKVIDLDKSRKIKL